jgi:hypothetical protein
LGGNHRLQSPRRGERVLRPIASSSDSRRSSPPRGTCCPPRWPNSLRCSCAGTVAARTDSRAYWRMRGPRPRVTVDRSVIGASGLASAASAASASSASRLP